MGMDTMHMETTSSRARAATLMTTRATVTRNTAMTTMATAIRNMAMRNTATPMLLQLVVAAVMAMPMMRATATRNTVMRRATATGTRRMTRRKAMAGMGTSFLGARAPCSTNRGVDWSFPDLLASYFSYNMPMKRILSGEGCRR